MNLEDLEGRQREVCKHYGSVFVASPAEQKVGISENAMQALMPLNGLRHQARHDATGWYIWRGEELSQSPDFFVPLHVAHLQTWCVEALPFLGLAPGWRFLKAGDHVDVWFDAALIESA